jgi:hypothetical protein
MPKGHLSWPYNAIGHQAKLRRVADSPTKHRPQISGDGFWARKREKPWNGGQVFVHAVPSDHRTGCRMAGHLRCAMFLCRSRRTRIGRSSWDHARSAVSTPARVLRTVKVRLQRSPNDNPRPPASDRIAPASSASNDARCRQLRTCGSIVFQRDALKASTSWHWCVPRQAGFHRELAPAVACSRHLGSGLACCRAHPSERRIV